MHTTNLRKVGGSVMLAVPPAILDQLHLRLGPPSVWRWREIASCSSLIQSRATRWMNCLPNATPQALYLSGRKKTFCGSTCLLLGVSCRNEGISILTSLDPAFGHEQKGTRPVLVVSADRFNAITRAP